MRSQLNNMEFRLCYTFVIAFALTINCHIYAIPLSDLLSDQQADSSESKDLSSEELSYNSTTNGTKKDL